MAWQLLFSSDIGLLSLFVIVFVLGMAIWFSRFFKRKMNESAQEQQRLQAGQRTPR